MWKDAAQGAVIQEGGQGAVCRNDAPGAVIWAHSYTAEPRHLSSHEPQAAALQRAFREEHVVQSKFYWNKPHLAKNACIV